MKKEIRIYINENDPEDKKAQERILKSEDMAIALHYIGHNLCRELRSEVESEGLKGEEIVDRVGDKIHEELREEGIDIDRLIS